MGDSTRACSFLPTQMPEGPIHIILFDLQSSQRGRVRGSSDVGGRVGKALCVRVRYEGLPINLTKEAVHILTLYAT